MTDTFSADYDWLPQGCRPTTYSVLQTDGHLLVIHNYTTPVLDLAKAHRIIANLLVRHGEVVDSPGSITSFFVWGGVGTGRKLVVFDHMGEGPPAEFTQEEYVSKVRLWWTEHGGRLA